MITTSLQSMLPASWLVALAAAQRYLKGAKTETVRAHTTAQSRELPVLAAAAVPLASLVGPGKLRRRPYRLSLSLCSALPFSLCSSVLPLPLGLHRVHHYLRKYPTARSTCCFCVGELPKPVRLYQSTSRCVSAHHGNAVTWL